MKKIILFIFVLLISLILKADTYLGEVWSLSHGNGVSEYIITTSLGIPESIYKYMVNEGVEVKKYCYFKKNLRTGKVLKCVTSDTYDEILTIQKSNAIGNKKVEKFVYRGQGKKLKESYKKWKKGKILQVKEVK